MLAKILKYSITNKQDSGVMSISHNVSMVLLVYIAEHMYTFHLLFTFVLLYSYSTFYYDEHTIVLLLFIYYHFIFTVV